MALFFHAAWFDEKLAERGLDRGILAQISGLSPDALELVFKDQRQLTQTEVAAFAELLGASVGTVALEAGIAGQVVKAGTSPALVDLSLRITQLEHQMSQVLARLAVLEQGG